MPTCETCGNDYDKAFQVTLNGSTHIFDSFECAIQALAPTCPHCGTHVVGHGVEKDGTIFCCAHCAKQEGVTPLRDRAWIRSGWSVTWELIEFPTYASALARYRSPEYQENIKVRLPHAILDLIVIEGYDSPQPWALGCARSPLPAALDCRSNAELFYDLRRAR